MFQFSQEILDMFIFEGYSVLSINNCNDPIKYTFRKAT